MGASPLIPPARPESRRLRTDSLRVSLTALALAAAAPGLAPDAVAAECGLYEAVEPGDTIASVAARCDVAGDGIARLNPDAAAGALRPGSVLSLPPGPAASLGRFEGLWHGTGSGCGGTAGTWHIAAERVRANGTEFDVGRVERRAGGLRADLLATGGRRRVLDFRSTGPGTLAVTGDGLAADLTLCDAPRHPPEAGYETGHAPIETPRFLLREAAWGEWVAAGRRCGTRVGTWSVREDRIRGNATWFEVRDVRGAGGGRIAVDVARQDDDARLTLTMAPGPSWQTLAITGPGIAVDLRRCPG